MIQGGNIHQWDIFQLSLIHILLETSGRNKLSDLAQIIIGENYKRVMVFCDTKFNTATLANQMCIRDR